MGTDGSAESRKRTRATPAAREPAIPWSFKKRKLNAAGLPITSSPTTPKTTPGAGSSTAKKPTRQIESSPTSAYDVPDSPENNPPPQRLRNIRSVDRPTDKVPIPPRRKTETDIYDIPDSGDELHSSPEEVSAQKASPTRRRSNGGVGAAKATEKRTSQKENNKPAVNPEEKVATVEEPSSLQVRSSGRRRTLTAKALEVQEKKVGSRSATPVSHARSSAAAHDVPESKKATTKTNRNISMPLKGILTPSKRDGSAKRSKSVAFDPGNSQDKEEVFFEDLPTKSGRKRKPSQKLVETKTTVAKTSKPRKAPTKVAKQELEAEPEEEPEEEPEAESEVEAQEEEQVAEEQEEEDEEVCTICSKPDSKPGNRILFCDGCDKGYHQKCYNVPKVPRGDWFCNDCVELKESRAAAADEAVKIPNFEQHLSNLKRVLLDRCTGRRRIKLVDQDEAFEKAHQLVEQTVLSGEGNSMLVIGARGCGKTTVCDGTAGRKTESNARQLVESIVDDLSLQHKQEFHVVRLNGFIHTDDKLALKEIWRQLGKEMEAEDEANARVSASSDVHQELLMLTGFCSQITPTRWPRYLLFSPTRLKWLERKRA